MRLFFNVRIYERIGGLYDASSLGFWSREVRRQAARALDLREDERLLIIGVGTGMELEHLPVWVRGEGVDLSAGMLDRALRRRVELGMHNLDLRVMDTRTLGFPEEGFEAVYLPLILTVVENGARGFAEAVPRRRAGRAAPEQGGNGTGGNRTERVHGGYRGVLEDAGARIFLEGKPRSTVGRAPPGPIDPGPGLLRSGHSPGLYSPNDAEGEF